MTFWGSTLPGLSSLTSAFWGDDADVVADLFHPTGMAGSGRGLFCTFFDSGHVPCPRGDQV